MDVLKLALKLVNMQYKFINNESIIKHGNHLAWILLLSLFIVGSHYSISHAQGQSNYTIAAASKTGSYFRLSSLLAKEINLAFPEFHLTVMETSGSRENAGLIEEGKVDFALIQNDIAYLESYYSDTIRGVASLYTEPVHIICRKELPFESVSDFKKYNNEIIIGTGPRDGGTFAHANIILKSIFKKNEKLQIDISSFEKSLDKMKKRQLDILFYTIGSPANNISEFSSIDVVKLLKLDAPIAREIRKKYPFFVLTTIPYKDYTFLNKDLTVLGIRSLLVTHKSTPEIAVSRLLQALFNLTSSHDPLSEPFSDISINSSQEGMTVSLHPAAQKYFDRNESYYFQTLLRFWDYAIPVFIFLFTGFIIIRAPRIFNLIHQYTFGRLFVVIVFIWLFGASLMFLIEGTKNEYFDTFGKASMAILYYLFTGFESRYPVTTAGNVVSIGIICVGIGLVGLFTGTIVTVLVEKTFGINNLRKKPKFLFRLKNHVIIAGWSRRTRHIIQHLRKKDIKNKPTIIVITEKADETKIASKRMYKDVWVVEGQYSMPKILNNASINTAKIALILSEEPANVESDMNTIVTGMEMERLNSEIHTVAEALRPESSHQLKNSKIDEIISVADLSSKLLSQCIITPGILNFYNQVVEFGLDSQEFYFSTIPKQLYGFSFHEIQQICKKHLNILPVGLAIKNTERKIFLNPKPDHFGHNLRDEKLVNIVPDNFTCELVLLADIKPNLSKLIKNVPLSLEKDFFENMNDRQALKLPPKLKREKAMDTKHIVICHWNDKTRKIIDELQSSVLEKYQKYKITVLSPSKNAENGTSESSKVVKNVTFAYGDPTQWEVLNSLGINEVDTFVILADMNEPKYTDYKSLITAQMARSLNSDIHIVIEVLNSENVDLFNRTDDFELVAVTDITEKLMAQATITPGLTDIYMSLLTATEDSNEIYILPVPEGWVEKKYSSIADKIIQSEEEMIVLGYQITPELNEKNKKIIINPKKHKVTGEGFIDWQEYRLCAGDSLVLMAYKKPDLSA